MRRPYTGDKRPIAKRATPHIVALVECIETNWPALWNNGMWAVREMRSKNQMSVHAKGTAADVSYRFMGNKGKRIGGRKQSLACIAFLVDNADALGIEMIIDYKFGKFGRTWKCTRNAWQVYQKPTVQFGGSGDWFHLEVDGNLTGPQVKTVFRSLGMVA